jgi:hypothetical protein
LNLPFGCHKLPLREGDKVKITFEELIFMGRTIHTNDGFFDLVSKTPLQISKGHGLGVEKFQFHQILY